MAAMQLDRPLADVGDREPDRPLLASRHWPQIEHRRRLQLRGPGDCGDRDQALEFPAGYSKSRADGTVRARRQVKVERDGVFFAWRNPNALALSAKPTIRRLYREHDRIGASI